MDSLSVLGVVVFIYFELDHQVEGNYNCNMSLSHAFDLFKHNLNIYKKTHTH